MHVALPLLVSVRHRTQGVTDAAAGGVSGDACLIHGGSDTCPTKRSGRVAKGRGNQRRRTRTRRRKTRTRRKGKLSRADEADAVKEEEGRQCVVRAAGLVWAVSPINTASA